MNIAASGVAAATWRSRRPSLGKVDLATWILLLRPQVGAEFAFSFFPSGFNSGFQLDLLEMLFPLMFMIMAV